MLKVWADGTLTWHEFLDHFGLPPLPEGFIVPSDSGVRLEAELDDNGVFQLSASVTNPLALHLQIPGMPQPVAPIQASLDQVAVKLSAGSSGGAVGLELHGSFDLHPFIPPLDLPIAQYLTPLFATLPELSGACRLTLGADLTGRPKLEFDATLDNAEVDIDIVGMLRDLAAGLSNPQGSATEVPLEIDFGFRLIGLSFTLGGESPASGSSGPVPFAVRLKAQVTLGSVEAIGEIAISDKEFSFGLDRMTIPLAIPRFPITRHEFERWYNDPDWKSVINGQIAALEADASRRAHRTLSRLQVQKLLMDAVFSIRDSSATGGPMSDAGSERYGNWLATILGALDDATSVLAGADPEDAIGRGATIRAMIGGEEHRICENLCIIVRDVKFRVPFRSPRDIGVSGGAQFSGFVGPYTMLNNVELKLGLSADLIYFTIKTIDGNIEIPPVDRYTGGSINFSEFRFGFGYTKRSLAIAFAGGVVLPRQLVEDLDTSVTAGAGIRLPVQTRLSFRFELMPVPVVKIVPLFQFNLDLRQNYSPGLADSSRCIPYWDGLQVIVPNVIHVALKHIAYSPLFAILPAQNGAFDGDIVLGDEHNGFSLIMDEMLSIDAIFTGTAFKLAIPGFADDTPFCENFCMSLRVAGFAVNFNVQRPFPSFSPLALFEILALLSDPANYKVNPQGDLANSLRVTLKDAYVVLPDAVRRWFPGSEDLLRRPLNITINLADYIGAAQKIIAIAKPIVAEVIEAVKQGAADAQNIPTRLDQIKSDITSFKWRDAITWLPAEVRTFSGHASFAGFSADATVVLMTSEEALAELRRRGKPLRKTPVFHAMRPDKPLDLEAFRGLCFSLPVPAGVPAIHNRRAPENNAFAAPAFDGLTTTLLRELLPSDDELSVIAAALVQVLDMKQRLVGRLSSNGSFHFISTSDVEPFVVRIAGLVVPVPLAFHGRLVLAGDRHGGWVQALVDATWDVLPGMLKLAVGRPSRPVSLQISSDGRFSLQGPAEIDLFNGTAGIKGAVDITESHCLVDGVFKYALEKVVKVEASGRGSIGPQDRFDLAGNGTLTIFGKAFPAPSFRLNERGFELETNLQLNEWKLPKRKSIPCNIDLKLRGGIDFRAGVPNFLLAGEGNFELFDGDARAVLSGGRGGVRYQDGQLTVFAEGVLRWHGHEWINARIELGPDGTLIQGRVSLPLEITPPGFTAGMVAALNLFARLRIDPASGNLLDLEARGDWLLGITLPGSEQILPIACNKLPTITAPQLPYQLIKIDGFPVPKIKDFSFDFSRLLPELVGVEPPLTINLPDSVTLPLIDDGDKEVHRWKVIDSLDDVVGFFTSPVGLVKSVKYKFPDGWTTDRKIPLNMTPDEISIYTGFTPQWPDGTNFPSLPFEQIPGFSLWLAWNSDKKRFEITSESSFPPPRIGVLYDPAGIDIAGEYVEILNTADIPIDLTGYKLHDAADYTHTYNFPPFTLLPGEKVKIWTKAGSNDAGNLYWGLKHAVWNNERDTVVLKDVQGVERVRYSYRRE